jgi:hypothetical protein
VVRIPGVTRAYMDELVSVAQPFGAVKCTFQGGDALVEMDTREQATSFFDEAQRRMLKVGPTPVVVVPTDFTWLSAVEGVAEVADVRQLWRTARFRAIERLKLTDASEGEVDQEFRDILREHRTQSKGPEISQTLFNLMNRFVKDGNPSVLDFHFALDTLLELPYLHKTPYWNRTLADAKVHIDVTMLIKLARVLIRSGQPKGALELWESRSQRIKDSIRAEMLHPIVEDLVMRIAPNRLELPAWQQVKVAPRLVPTEDVVPEMENEHVEVAMTFCELIQEYAQGPPSWSTLLLLLDLYCASGKMVCILSLCDMLCLSFCLPPPLLSLSRSMVANAHVRSFFAMPFSCLSWSIPR